MSDQLLLHVERVKSDGPVPSPRSEDATKQGLILPVLSYLGWDIFNVDEVYPEYALDSKRVDYSLRHGGENKVFVEAKHTEEDLEKHQEQLLQYAFKEGVEIAVLTNGISWWFFLPMVTKTAWADRRFYSVHIPIQAASDVCANLSMFLSRDSVVSGEAVRSAQQVHNSQAKEKKMRDAIPKAWNDVLNDHGGLLYELLAEETEKICGHKPTDDLVAEFLNNNRHPIPGGNDQVQGTRSIVRSEPSRSPRRGVERATGEGDRGSTKSEVVRDVEKRLKAKLHDVQVSRGRGKYFASEDGTKFVIFLTSKYYESNQGFWFGLRENQIAFLSDNSTSYLALVCGDGKSVFLMKWVEVKPLTKKMNITQKEDTKYYHIKIFARDGRYILGLPELSNGLDITQYFG